MLNLLHKCMNLTSFNKLFKFLVAPSIDKFYSICIFEKLNLLCWKKSNKFIFLAQKTFFNVQKAIQKRIGFALR